MLGPRNMYPAPPSPRPPKSPLLDPPPPNRPSWTPPLNRPAPPDPPNTPSPKGGLWPT